jgi:hypothetical protein
VPSVPGRQLHGKKPKRGELRTLDDARAYALKRNPGTTDRAWQNAMKLMLAAADWWRRRGGN